MRKLLEISGVLCKDNGLHRGIKCKKISLSWPFSNSQMSSRLPSVIIYDLLLIAYNLMMLDLGNYIQVPEKTEYTYDWGSLSWVIFLQSIHIANINFENVVKPSSNFLIQSVWKMHSLIWLSIGAIYMDLHFLCYTIWIGVIQHVWVSHIHI